MHLRLPPQTHENAAVFCGAALMAKGRTATVDGSRAAGHGRPFGARRSVCLATSHDYLALATESDMVVWCLDG